MRWRSFTKIILAWFVIVLPAIAHAEPTLQQRYLDIYVSLHDAESLEKKGDYAGALKGFQACRDGLAAIHQSDPDWETSLILHRMSDCKVTIEKLQTQIAQAHGKPTTPDAGPQTQLVPPPQSDLVFKTNAPPPANATNLASDFVFANFSRKSKLSYPWKTNIITTMFYIGEKSSMNNAWKLQLPKGTSGNDSPEDRNGYASGKHAAFFNPFYVALPFNDLAYPDKAKQYLPTGWQRPDKDGKPVSACKDRWVEIKTADGSGHICYAQWEDVGPGNPDDAKYDDDAEYVFGNAKPRNQHSGIDVSPAVAQYLGLADEGKPYPTRWRFVDPEDVPPGAWLKYDEQAVIYTAMHQMKDAGAAITPDK